MKYIITRAKCKLSNGTIKIFRYDANNTIKQNICDNIEVFRANLKKAIEAQMGVTVLSIALTYEECGNRK